MRPVNVWGPLLATGVGTFGSGWDGESGYHLLRQSGEMFLFYLALVPCLQWWTARDARKHPPEEMPDPLPTTDLGTPPRRDGHG